MSTFTRSNNGTSTTNTINDTAWFYLGGEAFGIWTTVTAGWIVNGPGVTNGIVQSINLFTDIQEFNAKSVTVVITGGEFTAGAGYAFSQPAVECFVEGTRILTEEGYKAVETLTERDLVVTSDNRHIKFNLIKMSVAKANAITAPYRISAHAFGKNSPRFPLHISGTHKIQIGKDLWISPERAARVNTFVRQYGLDKPVTYYHIECGNYLKDNLIAEGAVVESYGTIKSVGGLTSVYTWSDRLRGFTRISHESMLHSVSRR